MARSRRGNPRTATFLTLHHFVLDAPAFRALSPAGVKVLLRMARRFNGQNNGAISFSVREAAAECECAFNTARRALVEIQDKGFAVVTATGAFSLKDRHATLWRLTFLPSKSGSTLDAPSNEFLRWSP